MSKLKNDISKWNFPKNIVKAVIILMLLIGCSDKKSIDFENAMVFYKKNRLEEAMPLFQQHLKNYPFDADAYPWLAETYRRLGKKKEALSTAFMALELDTCNSFAYTVAANTINRLPEKGEPDSVWIYINKAIECNSYDVNAWACLCVEAMLRNKFDIFNLAAAELKESEFLTDALLAYGEWMMKTLPDSAILITNGDMDTYPPLALQAADDYRTDVAVVEKEWLGLKQYLFYLRDKYGLTIPYSEDEIDRMFESKPFPDNMRMVSDSVFSRWLKMSADGSLSNPIALATTVNPEFFADVKDRLEYNGPFLLYIHDSLKHHTNVTALESSIASIDIDDFSGPWVSDEDYSPIRISHTNKLAGNITFMALRYVEELIRSGNMDDAREILDWTEEFENTTELGPVMTERISELRKQTGADKK